MSPNKPVLLRLFPWVFLGGGGGGEKRKLVKE
jgi:hypothetical protein